MVAAGRAGPRRRRSASPMRTRVDESDREQALVDARGDVPGIDSATVDHRVGRGPTISRLDYRGFAWPSPSSSSMGAGCSANSRCSEGIVDVIPVDLVVAAICAGSRTRWRPRPSASMSCRVASGSVDPLALRRLVDLVQSWFTDTRSIASRPGHHGCRVGFPGEDAYRSNSGGPKRASAGQASAVAVTGTGQAGRVAPPSKKSVNSSTAPSARSSSTARTPNAEPSTGSIDCVACGTRSTTTIALHIRSTLAADRMGLLRTRHTPAQHRGRGTHSRERRPVLASATAQRSTRRAGPLPDRHLAAFDLEHAHRIECRRVVFVLATRRPVVTMRGVSSPSRCSRDPRCQARPSRSQ